MTVLAKESASNGTIKLYPQSGGQGKEYARVTHHRSATSARSMRRYTAEFRAHITASNLQETPLVCEQTISKVASDCGVQPMFSYKRCGRKLLVTESKDQIMLQLAGGMTDRQMIAFNEMLGKLTGLSVHERKNSLASLVDETMPDFSVNTVKVHVGGVGQKVERQVFLVDRISEVVCSRITSLLDNHILVGSPVHTLLEDDTIILRFGGDKGGKFMQFKFGVTVMNCQEPNSPDAFDMLASLDAPDTYFNMKYAIFDKYTEELEFYFNSKDPEVWLLMDGEDTCLSSFVCNDTNQRGFEDLWSKRGKTIVSEKGIDTRLTTGPFRITDKTTLQVLVGADQSVRMGTSTGDGN